MIGKEIHHYKILEKLGEGGMGVVYKAQDTKLDRIVALKFLPTHSLGNDDDRKRFETEAKAAAALNHPNIATVYEINDHEGDTFIAMEFVDGDTLEDKIKKAPLKIKDAMKIAKQVADGLAAAHEKDIFHRDIKGSNVMVTAKGVVKIMDFGLAKMSSATIVTKAGMTLGTVGYMSPEQSKGEIVDHRTDIWSLGVVFYEMIAGVRPFKGEYETALVYSILNVDPEPLTGLRTGVPMDLEKIINKLLAKDPDERYQNIIELPVDLKNVNLKDVGTSQAGTSQVGTSRIGSSVITQTADGQKQLNVKVNFSLGTIIKYAAVAVLFFISAWFLKPGAPPQPPETVRKYTLPLPEDQTFFLSSFNRMAISPDGRKVVYVASTNSALYMKDLYTMETTIIEGGESGRSPFFFPDGRRLGFITTIINEIKTVPVDGGAPLTVTKVSMNNVEGSASWGPDNTIIFTDDRVLKKVSASSGTPVTLTTLDEPSDMHLYPHVLPGEKAMLFTISSNSSATVDNRLALYSFDTGGHSILLDEEGYNAVYSNSGHILYGRSGMVMAVRFDINSMEISGIPVPVLDNVQTNQVASMTGSMSFALSGEGTAVYVEGDDLGEQSSVLTTIDPEGNASLFDDSGLSILRVRYSPDGQTVAMVTEGGSGQNISLYSIEGDGAVSTFTFLDGGGSIYMDWSPASEYLAFTVVNSEGKSSIFIKKSDNTGQAVPIYNTTERIRLSDWSDDGKYILFDEDTDLHVYSFEDSTARLYYSSPGTDADAQMSPNGRFVAYVSNEGSEAEMYVRPFPVSSEGLWKVSVDGGSNPVWSPDGKKLYFRAGSDIYSADVDITGVFAHRNLEIYITIESSRIASTIARRHDLHPDGGSFLVIQDKEVVGQRSETNAPGFILIENFFEELKRLAPVKKE